MAGVRELTDKRSSGTRLGQDTTDKVAFFGSTPVAQQSGADQTALPTTALPTTALPTTNITTTTGGDGARAAAIDALRDRVNTIGVRQRKHDTLLKQIRTDLKTLGLIKGSA